MSTENSTNEDLQDRLLDGALREVVGQETPPDLSEKIMLAASGQHAHEQTTLAKAEVDPLAKRDPHASRRVLWTVLTIAGSVLIGGALIFPVVPADRERARAVPSDGLAKPPAADAVEKANVGRAREQSAPESTDAADFDSLVDTIKSTVESDAWQDGGAADDQIEPFSDNLDIVVSQSQSLEGTESNKPLMMTVTPRIIVQDEEERLGVTLSKPTDPRAKRPILSKEVSPPSSAEPATIGLQGIINDAYAQLPEQKAVPQAPSEGQSMPSAYYLTDDVQYHAPGPEFKLAKEASELAAKQSAGQGQAGKQVAGESLPDYSVDLGVPFRDSSFGASAPQSGDKNNQAGAEQPETIQFSMGFGRDGQATQPSAATKRESWGMPVAEGDAAPNGQRFRIDASPGQEVNRHRQEFGDLSAADDPATREKILSENLAVKVQPAADLVLPVEPESEPASKEIRDRFRSDQQRVPYFAKPNSQREVSRLLREKMNEYHTLNAEIGGTASPIASAELNQTITEARQIQAEIINNKQELVDQTVNLELIRKQTSSTTAMERAVVAELDQDPKLANYKAEEEAVAQQIRALKANARNGTVAQVKRLSETLADLQQEAYKYRLQTEQEIRSAIKRAPSEMLDLAMTEHVARRRYLEANISKLKKQYETKVAAMQQFGDADSKLALLEAEIEQLQRLERGRGPGKSGDKYARIHENPFVKAIGEKAVSTFSIDVDTASYANVRQFLTQSGQLPPPDAVRIEELVNYFDYDYTPPTDDTPFAAHVEVAGCPWKAGHRLVRVGIKGREIETDHRPQSNLVFLVDVSGSMNEPAKLPLLVEGMKMLTRELGENDRIAIVVYASSEGLALPSTRGDQQDKILSALNNLRAGGSTAGGAGIQLAYEIAEKNFIKGGVNRVILATDGDFNVGMTGEGPLTEMAEKKAKNSGVFLTVLGFGRGNLNDSMMESISNAGNGNYHYVDNTTEARKVLVAEMAGTLVTIAKDVKIQVEFNPAQVTAYRLIGYENRMLKTEDFNNDKKDAGEIGAGHTVTAIYEVVPAGQTIDTPAVDPLKYQQSRAKPSSDADTSEELLTLKLRYKQPDEDVSTKLEFPITDEGQSFAKASDDFKFASAVASFGMLLRHSQQQGITSYSAVEEIAQDGTGRDKHGYRAEFLQLVRQAKQLAGE